MQTENNAQTQPVDGGRRLSLVAALSLLTALTASASVTLHLMGVTTHRTYLRSWGLDEGLFPKPADWLLINGYSAAFDRGIALLKLMSANLAWAAFAFLVVSLYFTALGHGSATRSGKQMAWPHWFPVRLRPFTVRCLQTLATIVALFFLIFASLALTAVPMMLGSAAGDAAMRHEERDFQNGCGKAKYSCIQLRKEDQVIGKGFVIDSSTAYIAIFDIDKKQVRALPREGTETLVIAPPDR